MFNHKRFVRLGFTQRVNENHSLTVTDLNKVRLFWDSFPESIHSRLRSFSARSSNKITQRNHPKTQRIDVPPATLPRFVSATYAPHVEEAVDELIVWMYEMRPPGVWPNFALLILKVDTQGWEFPKKGDPTKSSMFFQINGKIHGLRCQYFSNPPNAGC